MSKLSLNIVHLCHGEQDLRRVWREGNLWEEAVWGETVLGKPVPVSMKALWEKQLGGELSERKQSEERNLRESNLY